MKKVLYTSIAIAGAVLIFSIWLIYSESAKSNAIQPFTQLYTLATHIATATSTILTGLIAATIYIHQKEDQQFKEDTAHETHVAGLAKIIYLELKNSELIINEIKQNAILKRQQNSFLSYIDENAKEIPLSNIWTLNKHLFINRLNTDEFEHININYECMALAENARKLAINIFHTQAMEKAASQIRAIIEKSKELASDITFDQGKISEMRAEFDRRFTPLVDLPSNIFRPIEQSHMAEKAIEGLKPFLNSTTSQKILSICNERRQA